MHKDQDMQSTVTGFTPSLLLAFMAFLLGKPLRGTGSPAEAVLDYLMVSNILLGVSNLIPSFPLDGGRVLHSLIWKVTRNTIACSDVFQHVHKASS